MALTGSKGQLVSSCQNKWESIACVHTFAMADMLNKEQTRTAEQTLHSGESWRESRKREALPRRRQWPLEASMNILREANYDPS